MFFVYSIHFEPAFYHARHYIGITDKTLAQRLKKHMSGAGARITAGALKAGVKLESIHLLATYDTAQEARREEKKLKNNYHGDRDSRICPVCYLRKQNQIEGV